jgi:hypothetical protein
VLPKVSGILNFVIFAVGGLVSLCSRTVTLLCLLKNNSVDSTSH